MKPRLLLFVLAAVALAACGSEATTEAGAGQPGHVEAGDAEAIGFGESLAQIRGHHLVSLELYRAGDHRGASIHAGHPIDEILTSVASELEEHAPELSKELSDQLAAGARAIADGASVDELTAIYEEAASTTRRAEEAVIGGSASEPAYRGSVIAALLATAGHEYEEAVGDRGIRLPAEYQDGYAFVTEARRLYAEIAPGVESAAPEEADEIEAAFEALDAALPSAQPPKQPADALDVTSATKLIGHELEETVGATPAEESDPAAIVAEIEELLDEIVQTYRNGDADAAAELSAEAYLENYEVIEAEVIELAPEVNEELEPLLGADLRKELGAGAPVEEIEEMVARAKELLGEALEAIEGH